MVDTRIQLVCVAHPPVVEAQSALITVVDGVWALCEGNGQSGHEWVAIPPTRPQFAVEALPEQTRRRWWRRWWQRLRSSAEPNDSSVSEQQ